MWTQSLPQTKGGTQGVILVSSDGRVRETFGFLDLVKGVKFETLNPAVLGLMSFDLNDKVVIVDSREPSFNDIAAKIAGFRPRRVVLFGGRPNPFRDTAFSVTILDGFPMLPTGILRSIGIEGRSQRQTRAEGPAAQERPTLVKSDPGLKIIVADDDAGNRELYKAYLENEIVDLRFASNGLEALELQKERPAATIIADLRMPVMDGFTLIENLRQYEIAHQLRSAQVILVTADAHEETARKAQSYSGTQYLTKPIRKTQLMQAIKKSMDSYVNR